MPPKSRPRKSKTYLPPADLFVPEAGKPITLVIRPLRLVMDELRIVVAAEEKWSKEIWKSIQFRVTDHNTGTQIEYDRVLGYKLLIDLLTIKIRPLSERVCLQVHCSRHPMKIKALYNLRSMNIFQSPDMGCLFDLSEVVKEDPSIAAFMQSYMPDTSQVKVEKVSNESSTVTQEEVDEDTAMENLD